jgi:flagellar motor component MotA
MTDHIRNLIVKAVRHEEPRLDQTLLIQNLAERLRHKQNIGWFASDALIKLGLLGTIIGFILMLGPVATIEEFDVEHLKRALTAMTGGMAVALFTTLTGLIGSTLLKLQYQIIDKATVSLVDEITETTEVHVVSVLERVNAGI